MHASVSVREMIDEAADPYRSHFIPLQITAGPAASTGNGEAREPVGQRQPGVIFGLGNLIENATDFARNKVEIRADWSVTEVAITIADDGPGFAADVMDNLGDPYVTTRPASAPKKEGEHSGLGLGFFIAKTLTRAVRRDRDVREPAGARAWGGRPHRLATWRVRGAAASGRVSAATTEASDTW